MKMIAIYYSLLLTTLAIVAGVSLYQGTLSLIAARQLSQVEKQLAVNEQKNQDLVLQLAEKTAVNLLTQQAENSGYQAISRVAILEPITAVASR